MKRLFASLLLLVTLAAGCAEPPPYNNLDNVQLQDMLDKGTQIYDVRRPEEWQQTGVIKGSKLLTFIDANGQLRPDFLSRFTSEVGKDDPVILICRTGNRTDALARYLVEKLGYTNVYNVRDGIMLWLRQNKPVEKI